MTKLILYFIKFICNSNRKFFIFILNHSSQWRFLVFVLFLLTEIEDPKQAHISFSFGSGRSWSLCWKDLNHRTHQMERWLIRHHASYGYLSWHCLNGSWSLSPDNWSKSNICWRLILYSSMINLNKSHRPVISYRSIRPYDLEVLEKIHCDLFPIRLASYRVLDHESLYFFCLEAFCWFSFYFRYETEFFHNVVNGRDIVSWGAVDRNRSNGKNDELIGFITARVVPKKESEVRLYAPVGVNVQTAN